MIDGDSDIEHISLADWADLVVIAPATANIIGKTASGIADDLLSTTIIATTAPVLFIPAMNIHMYENLIVQENIIKLSNLGYFFMEPEFGKLACGYEGKGRYPENEEIIFHITTYLKYTKDLLGKNILVTAGASREEIDPMRFITNHSTGKMGLALARSAHIRGAKIKFIHSNISQEAPEYLDSIKAISAEEMHNAVIKEQQNYDIIFMTAAVADYTLAKSSKQKIKKSADLNLELMRTKDILKELGKKKTKDQILVGFAAESENIKGNALQKIKKKNLDFICANNLKVSGKDDTEILVLGKGLEVKLIGSKFSVAHQIIDIILNSTKKKK
ncbi:MAG: bifunctional phosphopantothenoylcysteine decarboxylase/phosphopantothenate--cysteine ligase CoaBC [Candidatus Cloacimonetes bacterium]|nr:bifunctional phosphopantothenoylcysteine decarboxylase/phosphopantothenate--cysteine ligase CoaBC [Candidatus Cloacimonadota bacterium]